MIPRTEIITITEGSGRIELRGHPEAFGLFIDGAPVALNWSDCGGIVAQEFFLLNADPLEDRMTVLQHLVENGPDPEYSLAQQLMPLLRHFPSGEYTLQYSDVNRPYQFPVWETTEVLPWPSAGSSYSWYYPDDYNFLPTQPDLSMSQEQILYYMLAIEEGMRPVAITTTVQRGWAEFILDGHHKLYAYSHLRISPRRICITAMDTNLAVLDWPLDTVPPSGFQLCVNSRKQ